MKNLKIQLLVAVSILAFASCSKDDEVVVVPPVVNEEEVITTVTTVFTEVGGTNTVTLKSKDLDGDGPGAPVVSPPQGTFALNKTYTGVVSVLNESVTPATNISAEILAEAADHQFFYEKTGNLPSFNYTPLVVASDNYDANGKPVGFKTTFVTTSAATGSLIVTLRHQGDKSRPNVANGDITNATGATDFRVTYTGLTVQ